MDSRGSRNRSLALGALTLALSLGLADAGRAELQSLADLAAGGGVVSLSGDLTFSDFEIEPTGDVNSDLSAYLVEPLEDGFRILPTADSLSLGAGEAGSLMMIYTLTGGAGVSVEGATLGFDAAATGDGSRADATEDFLDPETEELLGDLGVLVTGGGGQMTSDSVDLDPPAASFDVIEDVSLSVPPGEGSAAIVSIDQEFVVLPEPGSVLLALTALLGLAALKHIRRS